MCIRDRCEGSIRPLALGRKNWLHVGSLEAGPKIAAIASIAVSYTHLRAHETVLDLVCRLLLEKKKYVES